MSIAGNTQQAAPQMPDQGALASGAVGAGPEFPGFTDNSQQPPQQPPQPQQPQEPPQQQPTTPAASTAPPEGAQAPPGVGGGQGDQAESMAFREALKARGLPVDQYADLDDEALLGVLVDTWHRLPELEQWAQIGQFAAQNPEEAIKLLTQQQPTAGQQLASDQQQPAGAQGQPPAQQDQEDGEIEPPWGKPPEWDHKWNELATTDPQTGEPNFGSLNGYLLPRWMARRQWERKAAQMLLEKPGEVIKPYVEHAINRALGDFRKQIEDWFQQQRSTEQDQLFEASFQQAYEPYIYETDAQGRPIIDPRTNQPIYSDYGRRLLSKVDELRQMGVKDLAYAYKTAMEMLPPPAPPGTDTPQTPATQGVPGGVGQSGPNPAEAAKQRFLNPPADRSGSFQNADQGEQFPEDISPAEMMKQFIARHGAPALPGVP